MLRDYFTFRSSHQRCSVKRGALRNFTKFAGKRLCQSLCLNKSVSVSGLQLIKKETLAQVFSCEFYEISGRTSASEPWETNLPSCPRRLLICLRISNKLYRINRWVNYFLIQLSTTGILFSSCLL